MPLGVADVGAVARVVYGVNHGSRIANGGGIFQSAVKRAKRFAGAVKASPAHGGKAGRGFKAKFLVWRLKCHCFFPFVCMNTLPDARVFRNF